MSFPRNPDTGLPTYSEREEFNSLTQMVLSPDVVVAPGFALQSLSVVIFGNHENWTRIAERSRLQHPAEFDIGQEVVIPSERQL